MKIDPTVEQLIRDALTAAIRSDSEELATALGRFDGSNVAEAMTSLGATTLFALHHEYEGGPTPPDMDEVADDVVANEEWASLDRRVVLESLKMLQGQDRPVLSQGIDPRELCASWIVAAGYLLASSTDPPKSGGSTWMRLKPHSSGSSSGSRTRTYAGTRVELHTSTLGRA